MRAYKVFRIVKCGNQYDHHALFFETEIDRRGTILQVTGSLRPGMRVQRAERTALDRSWDTTRRTHIGWVTEEKYERVWRVANTVPPPRKTPPPPPHPMSLLSSTARPWCKSAEEWTTEVANTLVTQGVMEGLNRGSDREAAKAFGRTVDEGTDVSETSETDVEDYHRLVLARVESESEVSEEE